MRPFTRLPLFVLLAGVGLLAAGCGKKEPGTATIAVPVVKVARLQPADNDGWTTSGTVHAQIESPLAFRVPGQVVKRAVSAGERVKAGQLLITLDTQDLHEQLASAQAQLSSARAEAENAVAERERTRQLVEQKFVSTQAFDKARTAAEAALQRVAAAEAQLHQARNASGYANLTAPAAGVLLEMMAEPGQVVGAGQAVAVLAQDGPREVEVFVPQERRTSLSKQARVAAGGSQPMLNATLSELAGSADPVTRTWRARYRLQGNSVPDLGSIVRLEFHQPGAAKTAQGATQGTIYRVPVGALSERGEGPRLWVVANGKVTPQPVEVLRLDTEDAYVSSTLQPGTTVVALGTHLLTAGQAVRANER